MRLPLWGSPESCQAAIRGFLPYADLVKLSDDEVEFCTGCKTEREAAELLFSQGCRLLLVTRGAGGAAVYTPNASAETKALPVTVADTTGAGDSFIGSFLYQLTRDGVTAETLADIPQEKLADYLTFSSECSAYTVQHKGAVMPTEEELRMKNG